MARGGGVFGSNSNSNRNGNGNGSNSNNNATRKAKKASIENNRLYKQEMANLEKALKSSRLNERSRSNSNNNNILFRAALEESKKTAEENERKRAQTRKGKERKININISNLFRNAPNYNLNLAKRHSFYNNEDNKKFRAQLAKVEEESKKSAEKNERERAKSNINRQINSDESKLYNFSLFIYKMKNELRGLMGPVQHSIKNAIIKKQNNVSSIISKYNRAKLNRYLRLEKIKKDRTTNEIKRIRATITKYENKLNKESNEEIKEKIRKLIKQYKFYLNKWS